MVPKFRKVYIEIMNIYSLSVLEVDTMPGYDTTGPLGQGSLTGRGLGPCGCGMRRGFGTGNRRGRGVSRQVALTKEEEKKILEAQLREIDFEKQEIEKKLEDMK
jgi:hypothetical protein